MSDWTGQRPLPETPADTAPDLPVPWTPGWSQWIQQQADQLKEVAGRTDNPDGVTMDVTRGSESFWYASEGDNPAGWQKEGPTAEVFQPEYRDYTLFSRLYPKITVAEYIEVKVRLVFHFSNPEATWEKEFSLYERTGDTREMQNHKIFRWRWTSWENEINGVTVRIKDDSPPSNENVVPRIGYDEVRHYPDWPPPGMLPKPKPPAEPGGGQGGELYFAAAADGWMIASENTRRASAEIGWTKLSRLKRQGSDHGQKKG